MTRRFDWLPVFVLLYGAASLVHHVHNAVNLHDYPNMPPSLSVARVYLAWGATALVGVVGYGLTRGRHVFAGLVLLALFAALGLLGLAHYHLAPVGAHTLAMNASIGVEVATAGVLLFIVLRRLLARAPQGPAATT